MLTCIVVSGAAGRYRKGEARSDVGLSINFRTERPWKRNPATSRVSSFESMPLSILISLCFFSLEAAICTTKDPLSLRERTCRVARSGFVSTDGTRKTQCWTGTSRSRRNAVCIHVHMCRADCHGRLRKILRKIGGCWRQRLNVVAVFCCS